MDAPMRPAYATPRERFEASYLPDPTTGCWLWIGSLTTTGYGAWRYLDQQFIASRVSYEWHVGSIPDGMCVLHRCDVRACVNPAHLFLGTKRDNNRDRYAKGRFMPSTDESGRFVGVGPERDG